MFETFDPSMLHLGIYPKARIKYVPKMYVYHLYFSFNINKNLTVI